MLNFLLTTLAAVTLFAPDLDLSIGTEEEIQTLGDIGWNLDAEVSYLVEEKISSGSATSLAESLG